MVFLESHGIDVERLRECDLLLEPRGIDVELRDLRLAWSVTAAVRGDAVVRQGPVAK